MQHLTQLKTPQDQLNVLVVTEQTTLYDKLCTSLSQTSCQVEQQPDKNIALLQASLQMWDLILIDSSASDGSNVDLFLVAFIMFDGHHASIYVSFLQRKRCQLCAA